jgi:hypothetical protein
MLGVIPVLPPYTFMVWSSVKAQGQLHLYLQLGGKKNGMLESVTIGEGMDVFIFTL